MRILIVDDEELTLDLLRLTLEDAGHEVHAARNGREALAAWADGNHQLVISDWEMPEMNGLDLCRAVRRQALGSKTHIVLLTAHEGSACMVEGLAAGADAFLTKPLDADDLIARVRIAERIRSLETRDTSRAAGRIA